MLTLIENGEVFTPAPIGRTSVLLGGEKILKVGPVGRNAVAALEVDHEFIDATDCFVVPGFIDAHQHLLGGSGEKGFSSQTPEIHASEIVRAGVTSVVGCLGVDTTMKTMAGLLARAKALKEEGLNAFIWSGGYNVPPTTITSSIRDDIMFIEEVIGAGEIAISDERSTDPSLHELARLTNDAYVGGLLGKKAGVTHFHTGEQDRRLELLRGLIDEYKTPPESLYPTHIERSEALMDEAIDLSRRGCWVDIDTSEEDLHKWLSYFMDHDGDLDKLTISSDASISSPATLLGQVRECVVKHRMRLESVLPCVTRNPAQVLKFEQKGKLMASMSADVLLLDRDSFEPRDVVACGKRLIKDGDLAFDEAFLKDSNRRVDLTGKRAEKVSDAS
jgi:beta-aspartyl-dipeptidase (metallo-type)